MGIDLDKQLKRSDLSSNFRKSFLKKQDIKKTKAFELLIYDATTAGQVISELESIGISNVYLERTEYTKIEALKLELKSKAVKRAKQQAEALVKPLNQSVGKAIYITDIRTDIRNALAGKVRFVLNAN